MENVSGSLLIGLLMLLSVTYLVPSTSIGLALACHKIAKPDRLVGYLGFLASHSDPHRPANVIDSLTSRRPQSAAHSTHLYAAAENSFGLVVANLPIVANVIRSDYYTPGPIVGVFTIVFLVSEAVWFWWFRQSLRTEARQT